MVQFVLMHYYRGFDLFERAAFGFGHKAPHENELQYHHDAEEGKCDSAAQRFRQVRKAECNNCRHDPMGGTTQRLSLSPYLIWKNLRNKNPDHRPLRESEKGNEQHHIQRYGEPVKVSAVKCNS